MSTIAMDYDKKYDIFYARYPLNEHSYTEEDDDGIVTYHSIKTDKIPAIAVYSFKKRLQNGTLRLNMLPVPLDMYRNKINSMIS